MSSSASKRIVPAKWTSSSWSVAWRGSTEQVAVLRIRGRIGGCEVVALDGLRDEPVQLGGTDPSGDGGDLGVHERSGFDG